MLRVCLLLATQVPYCTILKQHLVFVDVERMAIGFIDCANCSVSEVSNEWSLCF